MVNLVSQIHGRLFQKELFNAYIKYSVVVVPRDDVVAHHDYFFKAVTGARERVYLLFSFVFVCDGQCGLNVISLTSFVVNSVTVTGIYLEYFADTIQRS